MDRAAQQPSDRPKPIRAEAGRKRLDGHTGFLSGSREGWEMENTLAKCKGTMCHSAIPGSVEIRWPRSRFADAKPGSLAVGRGVLECCFRRNDKVSRLKEAPDSCLRSNHTETSTAGLLTLLTPNQPLPKGEAESPPRLQLRLSRPLPPGARPIPCSPPADGVDAAASQSQRRRPLAAERRTASLDPRVRF